MREVEADVGRFVMEDGRLDFMFGLPKIPGKILEELKAQYATSACRGLEDASRVYYNKEEGRYVHVPLLLTEQTPVTVRFEEFHPLDLERGWVRVIDCHSHHRMRPFFSGRDVGSAVLPQLYLVAGNYRTGWSFVLKAGCENMLTDVSMEEVFK